MNKCPQFFKEKKNNEHTNLISKDDNNRNFKRFKVSFVALVRFTHRIYCVNFENFQCFANCVRTLLRA